MNGVIKNQKTVYVGLSGGVDSSVAALRLIKEGYNVVGVFIKVWQPDFLECNWEAERLDAMRVAAHLKIPFLTFDAAEAYRTKVGEYFVSEYLAGRTPNPDVMCNQFVKFGVFLDFALQNGADYVSTGHYATVDRSGSAVKLLRGIDNNKDQSYFLWALSDDVISKVLLPIGVSTKAEIREEAKLAGLPTATKKDSQGVCFLGQIDIKEFISHFTKLEPGEVVNQAGDVVGSHQGALVYTIGQRHGFTISEKITDLKPYYVVHKDLNTNTLIVDHLPPLTTRKSEIALENVNWINKPEKKLYTAQFRYRQTPINIELGNINSESVVVIPQTDFSAPDSGQSCVIYDGEICMGGGIII
jgi:tRNA-uridine 2-sulfurtransferase